MIGIKRREVYIVGKKTLKKSKQTNMPSISYLFLFGKRLKSTKMAGKGLAPLSLKPRLKHKPSPKKNNNNHDNNNKNNKKRRTPR